MVSGEPVLLAVAALDREFAGFNDRRTAEAGARWAWWSDWEAGRALLVAEGMGGQAARRALDAAAARYPIRAVVSTGFVGALDPAWRPGDIVVPERVRGEPGAVEYPVSWPRSLDGARAIRRGVLRTSRRLSSTAAQKRALRAEDADAVDMEAWTVAEFAAELGLPFYCVRAVSDAAETEMPVDFEAAVRPDGSVSGWRVARAAGWSLRRWRALLTLKRDGDRAARELSQYLRRCRF